ncbi:MAG: DUF3883 domain-containing protein [Aphanocapsa lilacina HA4352-LM1]|nr:DUF3883 domain-containing protein [Aphanocapsa lilacina HA4352-LM1]
MLFTEHRDTLNYLALRIRNLLGEEEAVVCIHGGMGREAGAQLRGDPVGAGPFRGSERAQGSPGAQDEGGRQGYQPRDASADKSGYDIESRIPGTGRLRFIKVKGRIQGAESVTVTRNEILRALNKPDDWLLAIVEVPAEELPEPGHRAKSSTCAVPLSANWTLAPPV